MCSFCSFFRQRLTKLMPLIGLAVNSSLCRLIPVGSIDSFAPAHSALQLAHLSRPAPADLDSSWFGINFCSAVLEFCSFLFHPVFDRGAFINRVFGGVLPDILSDFDELRQPANLALRVTFNVIYPTAPA
jgi:hypothetical protein